MICVPTEKGSIVGLYLDRVKSRISIYMDGRNTGHFIPMETGVANHQCGPDYDSGFEGFMPTITSLPRQDFFVNLGQVWL